MLLPNSRLADAIVTDYEAPEPPVLVVVPCGVAYDSDLQKVEDVSLEVAGQIIQDCPEAIKDFDPVLRFREFGDSNINFVVVLRAVNRVGVFVVRHEFIKALHRRFNEEGIEIQYPARKLHFSGELPLRVSRLEMEELIKNGSEGDASDEQSSPSG
jgi:small-conductance mechanosensitive channel